MITLTITGDTVQEIVKDIGHLAQAISLQGHVTAGANSADKAQVEVAAAPINLAAPAAAADGTPARRAKPGRPRKNSPAAQPTAEAQPAVAENTGSTASGFSLSPAAPASANPAPTSAPLSLAPTSAPAAAPAGEAQVKAYDAMRAKLQQILAEDPATGLRTVAEILARVGTTKVKDVLPEHYGAVSADADEALKSMAAAKMVG